MEDKRPGFVRGQVKLCELQEVKPNPWNPNEMPQYVLESIKLGFQTDGWLVSQALLIWGRDDKGKDRNVIIDGEHRWKAATELGMEEGPMVFIDGLSETDAMGLTVKLNQKRGDWNDMKLGVVFHALGVTPDEAMAYGFTQDEMMKHLQVIPEDMAGPILDPSGDLGAAPPDPDERPTQPSSRNPTLETSTVKMVQLFLDDLTQPLFMEHIKVLAEQWGTKNVTDTVLEAVRRCHEAEAEC